MFQYNYVVNSQVEHKQAQLDPIQVNQTKSKLWRNVPKRSKECEKERDREWDLVHLKIEIIAHSLGLQLKQKPLGLRLIDENALAGA